MLLVNVDYIIVGRIFGAQDLGYYTMAFNLASWPVAFFAVSVARVSVPAFAQLQHDARRMQDAYRTGSFTLLASTAPACLLLATFADPLIRFLYGDKWAPAVSVLRLLAVLGLLRVVYQFWADILTAVGASRRVLITQVVWLAGLVPGLWLASQHGLTAIGVGHVVVAVAVAGPMYVLMLRGVVRLAPGMPEAGGVFWRARWVRSPASRSWHFTWDRCPPSPLALPSYWGVRSRPLADRSSGRD